MRSEFDTLEQYQESMKEFNENTRMGFEEFIQSHGSDRNKLQLRCTPYTSKKGGYGSFDLDFGLCVYKHQQSKIDELQKRVEELTVGCGLQRDHIKGLEAELKKAWTTVDQEGHKNHELLMLLKFVREHFEMNDLDKAMPRVYEKLEQALKGGGE